MHSFGDWLRQIKGDAGEKVPLGHQREVGFLLERGSKKEPSEKQNMWTSDSVLLLPILLEVRKKC